MAMYILRSPKEGETLGRLSLGLTSQGRLWRVGERLREPQALVGSLSWCYTYFSSASPSPPLESRLSHLLPEKKDEGQTTQMLKKQRTSQPWCVEEDLRTLLKNKQTSNSGDWRLKCCHAGSLPLGRDAEPGLRWQQLKISQSGEGRRQGWATRNHDQGSPSRFQHRQRRAGGLGLLQPCPWAMHRELDSSSGPGRSLHHVPHTPRAGPTDMRRPGFALHTASSWQRQQEGPYQGGGRKERRGQECGEEENAAKGLLPSFMILLIPDLTASRASYSTIKSTTIQSEWPPESNNLVWGTVRAVGTVHEKNGTWLFWPQAQDQGKLWGLPWWSSG